MPPQTISCADDLRGPDSLAHLGNLPARLEPLEVRRGRGPALLPGYPIGAAPALRDHLVGQTIGEQTTRQSVFLPHIDIQLDDYVAGKVLQEVVCQPQGGRLVVGAQQYVAPLAQPTQAIRLLRGDLAQGRRTKRAQVAPHQVTRTEGDAG